MSLIERAAKRLEELRQAGIEVPNSNRSVDYSRPLQNSANSQRHANSALNRGDSAESIAKRPSEVVRSTSQNRVDLDFTKLASLGFVTPEMPRTRIADEFRVLKRPLIANMSSKRAVPIKHANLVMVTSSVPGEGKTFLAVNFAMSLAMELDRTVLLVDADVARPSLPGTLDFGMRKGVLDALENRTTDIGNYLLRTNVENLTILPSGTPNTHATELLASATMSQLLDDMSARYADRIIVFDSPPLLVTTEARVLATQMGQIVFVVHAENTLQNDVKRALAMIETCPVKLLVLNQVRSLGQGRYGYGYGYGYGG